MAYEYVELTQEITIHRIYTVHYFEYMSDFYYAGETHDFWEFLFVDKGEICVTAGDEHLSLKKDEIVFHKPNEFHNVWANGRTAPNIIVVSFETDSPQMSFFENRCFTVNDEERRLLAELIRESRHTFSSPLDTRYLEKMELSDRRPFGGEQMICLCLEMMLVKMMRRLRQSSSPPVAPPRLKSHPDTYERICQYLATHVRLKVTIEQICKDNQVGRTQLQNLFRERNGCGVIDYFCNLKIETAKQLIREQRMNFTQISSYLGYTSIHYLSRQFKKITGRTPSEYATSIKALSDPHSGKTLSHPRH